VNQWGNLLLNSSGIEGVCQEEIENKNRETKQPRNEEKTVIKVDTFRSESNLPTKKSHPFAAVY